MAKTDRLVRLGTLLLIGGLSILAVSSSFSISLTEGGLLLAGAGFALRLLRTGRRRIVFLDYVVLAFIAWLLVAAVMSPHRLMSLKAYRSEWLVLAYFVVSFGMESASDLRRILKLLAVTASLLAVYGVVQHFTGTDFIKHKSLDVWNQTYMAIGLLGHHITFGVFYSWAFATALAFLVFVSRDLKARIVWITLTSLSLLAVLYSYSRAAWIGTGLTLLIVASVRRFRLGYPVVIVLAIVVIAVALEPAAIQRVGVPVTGEAASKGDATRILLLRTSFRMIMRYPVFGIGPGTFMAEFENFKVPGDYSTTCHAHNDLINAAVRSGFVGLTILVTLLAASLWNALAAYRRARDSTTSLVGLALIGGLVAIVGSGLFQCNLTDSEIAVHAWLIMGSIALLMRIQNRDA